MTRILYITVSILFFLSSCGKKTNSIENEAINEDDRIIVTEQQFLQGEMSIGTAEEVSFKNSIKLNGTIDIPPESKAEVSAMLGGYIKSTPLLIGDIVEKGQLIATLENPEFVSMQQEYLEINEQLVYLKAEFDRQKTMFSENISSKKSYLKAESDYKTAVARHTGLSKQLQMLNIETSNLSTDNLRLLVSVYAPISGTITQVNVTKGMYVSPATVMVEIINSEHIHLKLAAFEKDIMKIVKGQTIRFKIPEASTTTYNASVHLVGTSINENRRTKVHAHIENESENNFLIGMFVEADIVIDSTALKAIPKTAIVAEDDINYILVLDEKSNDNYYFLKKEVTIKSENENFVSIEPIEFSNSKTLFKGAFNLIGE